MSTRFFQLNAHKCKASIAAISKELSGLSSFCFLMQEPHTYRGKVVGLAASIVASKNLNLWSMNDFSCRDVASAIMTNGDSKTIICSVYLDINKDLPSSLVRLMKFSQDKNYSLIIGMDSNAHSSLWGLDTNRRGEVIEEFILGNGLVVENCGLKPTFIGRGAETHIYITLSYQIRVTNWRVSDKDLLSDHALIEFEVPIPAPNKRVKIRNLRGVQRAVDTACPSAWVRSGSEKPDFWSREVALCRRNLSLRARKVSEGIIKWYVSYLRSRSITVELKGIRKNRVLTRGTPQGGVLSPITWNLVFDKLLGLFDSGPVKAIGFADDAALLISGSDPSSMVCILQDAINKALEWGNGCGLEFAPHKTVAILFHRKKEAPKIRNLNMNGINICLSNSVKYLGVTLDSGLNFEKRDNSDNKELELNCALQTFFLSHAQNIPRLSISNRSTPTKGLEVIFDLPPLDLYIKMRARKALFNLNITPHGWESIGSKPGHILEEWRENKKLGISSCINRDFSTSLKMSWKKTFYINYDSFSAEVWAILKAALLLLKKKISNQIFFYVDNQAALVSLGSVVVKSCTVNNCINVLNALGRVNHVNLHWIKSH
ncbi:Uncharacterized protein FKW44_015317, partial [Caligus rogercresseyi]